MPLRLAAIAAAAQGTVLAIVANTPLKIGIAVTAGSREVRRTALAAFGATVLGAGWLFWSIGR